MSTRSLILVDHDDGVTAVYCHSNGQPKWNGRDLVDHYADPERATALVAGGDLSVLGVHLDCPVGHSFDTPVAGACVYYGRDRGETDCGPSSYPCLAAAWPSDDDWIEWVYAWTGGCWQVAQACEGTQALRPVVDYLPSAPLRVAA